MRVQHGGDRRLATSIRFDSQKLSTTIIVKYDARRCARARSSLARAHSFERSSLIEVNGRSDDSLTKAAATAAAAAAAAAAATAATAAAVAAERNALLRRPAPQSAGCSTVISGNAHLRHDLRLVALAADARRSRPPPLSMAPRTRDARLQTPFTRARVSVSERRYRWRKSAECKTVDHGRGLENDACMT